MKEEMTTMGAWQNLREMVLGESLRPEFEKLVDKHYKKIMSLHKDGKEPSEDQVKGCLRDLLHDVERAEGEDPKELDRDGPKNESQGYGYEDAVELDDVTPQEARREVEKHGAKWDEFVREVGNKPKYSGKEVLDWLGY